MLKAEREREQEGSCDPLHEHVRDPDPLHDPVDEDAHHVEHVCSHGNLREHTHHAERVRDPDGVRLHDGVAVHMDRGGRGEERRGRLSANFSPF